MIDLPGTLRYLAARLASGPPGLDLDIHHRPGAPTSVRGRVPRGKAGAIREFFDRDLRPPGPVRVWGSARPGRPLVLNIAGPLGPRERQRLRNALALLLD